MNMQYIMLHIFTHKNTSYQFLSNVPRYFYFKDSKFSPFSMKFHFKFMFDFLKTPLAICFDFSALKPFFPSWGCSLSANQSVLTVLFSLIFLTEYPNLAEKYSRPYWCLSMSWGTSKCPISNEGHFSHQTTASTSNNTKPFSSDTWENSSKLWWFGSTLTEI